MAMKVLELISALLKCHAESKVELCIDPDSELDKIDAVEIFDARFDIREVDNGFEEISDGKPALVILRAGKMTGWSGGATSEQIMNMVNRKGRKA